MMTEPKGYHHTLEAHLVYVDYCGSVLVVEEDLSGILYLPSCLIEYRFIVTQVTRVLSKNLCVPRQESTIYQSAAN